MMLLLNLIVSHTLLCCAAKAAGQLGSYMNPSLTSPHLARHLRTVIPVLDPPLLGGQERPKLEKRGDGKKKQHKKKKKKKGEGAQEASTLGEETRQSDEQGTSRLSKTDRQGSADLEEAQSRESRQRDTGHHPWEPEGDNE